MTDANTMVAAAAERAFKMLAGNPSKAFESFCRELASDPTTMPLVQYADVLAQQGLDPKDARQVRGFIESCLQAGRTKTQADEQRRLQVQQERAAGIRARIEQIRSWPQCAKERSGESLEEFRTLAHNLRVDGSFGELAHEASLVLAESQAALEAEATHRAATRSVQPADVK